MLFVIVSAAPKMLQGSQEPLNLRMDPGFYPFYRNSLSNSIAKRYLLQQGNKNVFFFYIYFSSGSWRCWWYIIKSLYISWFNFIVKNSSWHEFRRIFINFFVCCSGFAREIDKSLNWTKINVFWFNKKLYSVAVWGVGASLHKVTRLG